MPEPASSTPDRGLTRRWKPRNPGAAVDPGTSLVDRVLAARGLVGETAAEMLDPSLLNLHDPSQIPDLDRAAERLLEAVRAHEPVVVYGDYDVDGITATAILVRTLRAIDADAPVRTYVPHRLDEGYGLNSTALEQLAAEGARVVVSVDCGITAVEPAAAARAAGLDLIITDHHHPPESDADLPGAHSVVHPRRPGSAYPFGELCGAGVAYKLAWRLLTLHAGTDRLPKSLRTLLLDLLAFAAMGTVADIVPLLGENRVLTRFGLGRIADSPFIGLRALIEASGFAGEKIDAERVGFALGPRLNACGRMGHAREAVDLMLTENAHEAERIAGQLCALNDQRRKTEREIVEAAAERAEAMGMTGGKRRAIVLADPAWHPGVVGIVCSRLVEKFGRPTILMQHDEATGTCAGSGRSIDGFNLHAGLAACAHHLNTFGGHDMAAGLRLDAQGLDAFTEAFIEHANARLEPDDLVPSIGYDTVASLEELTGASVRSLARLAPFGRDNPRVSLKVEGVRLCEAPRVMGRSGDHLAIRVESGSGADRRALRIVAWGWGEHADKLIQGSTLDLVLTPKLNTWNGQTKVEAELRDLRIRTERPPEVEVRSNAARVYQKA
ncbi:MAG: single-stranded-DNA-specific exonuclease RecJ [Planctomycetota bacterium]